MEEPLKKSKSENNEWDDPFVLGEAPELPLVPVVIPPPPKKRKKWIFPMVDGKPHGEGEYYINDVLVYKGSCFAGKFHGKCWVLHSDGKIYIGNTFASKRHGKGIIIGKDGTVLYGTWIANRMHGIVKRHCENHTVETEIYIHGYPETIDRKSYVDIIHACGVTLNVLRNPIPYDREFSIVSYKPSEKLNPADLLISNAHHTKYIYRCPVCDRIAKEKGPLKPDFLWAVGDNFELPKDFNVAL